MNGEKKLSVIVAFLSNFLNVVQSMAQLLGMLLPSIGTFAAARFLQAPWQIIAIATAAPILLFLLIRHFFAEQVLSLAHGLLPMDKTYECRNKVAEYTYENRETMTFRVSYDVKIHSGPHDFIPDRIKWSAGEVRGFDSIVEGQHVSLSSENENRDTLVHLGFQGLRIDLPKVYSKQDRAFPTGYFCKCPPDPQHHAIPCLAICIYQKVNRLTLRVRFERSLVITNIRKQKFARYLDEVPYYSENCESKEDKDPRYNCVEFVIKHPIPGGKYAIDWEFSD